MTPNLRFELLDICVVNCHWRQQKKQRGRWRSKVVKNEIKIKKNNAFSFLSNNFSSNKSQYLYKIWLITAKKIIIKFTWNLKLVVFDYVLSRNICIFMLTQISLFQVWIGKKVCWMDYRGTNIIYKQKLILFMS